MLSIYRILYFNKLRGFQCPWPLDRDLLAPETFALQEGQRGLHRLCAPLSPGASAAQPEARPEANLVAAPAGLGRRKGNPAGRFGSRPCGWALQELVFQAPPEVRMQPHEALWSHRTLSLNQRAAPLGSR